MKKIIKRILIYFINDAPVILGFFLVALEYLRITIRLTEDIFERGEKYMMLYLVISYLCYLIISNLKYLHGHKNPVPLVNDERCKVSTFLLCSIPLNNR